MLSACGVDTPTPSPRPTVTPTRPGLPQPSAFARSSWTTDPYSLGSHSYMAVGSTPAHRDALREPVLDRIFFAGEATSADKAGTVDGALDSGARAAADLAIVADRQDKIAVIGAGLAGAEAARILKQNGYDVVVIEARDRIGGRIRSVTSKSWPTPVELGAWRTSDDAATHARLDQLSIATAPLETKTFVSPTSSASSYPAGPAAVTASIAWAEQQAQDVSLHSALDGSGAAKTAEGSAAKGFDGAAMLQQYLGSLATLYGADPTELSSWYGIDQDVPGEVVTGGYSALVQDALDGVKTSLSTVVAEVAYTDSGVSLRLGSGESLRVDRVVVTVPLGVLKKGGMKFAPLLPLPHRTAISSLGVGSVETVWLRFDTKFWTTDAAIWNLVGTDDDITSWINLEPLTAAPVVVGLVGGEAAHRVTKLNDEQLTAASVRALQPFADA